MNPWKIIFFTFSWIFSCSSFDFSRVCFVLLSNPNSRHEKIAKETLNQILTEFQSHGTSFPIVYSTHQNFTQPGDWTYFPLFNDLLEKTKLRVKWFIFLEENSVVNSTAMDLVLSKYDYNFDHFIGFSVDDGGIGSIVHRFIQVVIEYPDTSAGFILSRNHLSVLSETVAYANKLKQWNNFYIKEFTMDAPFEIALTSKSIEKNPVTLQHEPLLCPVYHPGCAIYPRDTSCQIGKHDLNILLDKTLFAVKTCSKFHEDRIPILKETWLKSTKHFILVSDSSDDNFGTVVLPGAESNQIRGHCQKTDAILKYFLDHAESHGWTWLVVTDDDTILSVAKLLELVNCYDELEDEPIAVGSPYGFRLVCQRGMEKFDEFVEDSIFGGFDYLAGGGGMVFNKRIVKDFIQTIKCRCAQPDFHDDMHLGLCQQRLGIPIIRNPRFHQARPEDYNRSMLIRQNPISFHKFEETDPIKIYQEWFATSDEELIEKRWNSNDEL